MASSPLEAGLAAAGLSDAAGAVAAGVDADELAGELALAFGAAAAVDKGAVAPSAAACDAGASGDEDAAAGVTLAFCSLRARSRARSVSAMCSWRSRTWRLVGPAGWAGRLEAARALDLAQSPRPTTPASASATTPNTTQSVVSERRGTA